MFFLKALLVVLCLAPILRSLFFRGAIAHPVESPPEGILDMHCHIAGIGAGESGNWVSDGLRYSWKFPLYLKVFETSKSELQSRGDHSLAEVIADRIRESHHVDGAVVLAMDAAHQEDGTMAKELGELYVPNKFVEEAVRNIPELYFGASVHPARVDAVEELKWAKEHGAVLVKWLPNIQNIDPSNEKYIPFYEALVELDLPLLTHVGAEDSFSKADDRLGDPYLLELPLSMGVRVIAAHVASSGQTDGVDNIDRLLEMMPKHENLVADISTLTQLNRAKYLPKVLNDSRLKGRLMYGTDHPLTNTPLVTPLQFWLNLDAGEIWDLLTTKNPWDRDVRLKAALGTPAEVFTMSRQYLGL